MKRIALLLVAASAVLVLASCVGTPGNIYGQLAYDEDGSGLTLYTSGVSLTGGFPSNWQADTEYLFEPGSYNFTYYLEDTSGNLSPGPTTAYVWSVSYTLSANKGTFLNNGSDKHFAIYCSWYGDLQYGDLSVVGTGSVTPRATSQADTTRVYSKDGLKITYTVKKVKLTQAEIAQFKPVAKK